MSAVERLSEALTVAGVREPESTALYLVETGLAVEDDLDDYDPGGRVAELLTRSAEGYSCVAQGWRWPRSLVIANQRN